MTVANYFHFHWHYHYYLLAHSTHLGSEVPLHDDWCGWLAVVVMVALRQFES